MSVNAPARATEAIVVREGALAQIRLYASLTKPRIVMLVVLTALLGYFIGARGDAAIEPLHLALALFGTALVAGGSNALNMCFEREQDGLMERTRHRALPAGRLRPDRALAFSIVCGSAGVLTLALAINTLTALLGAVAIAIYAFIYTPMKRVSHISLLIGAVPGALPPVMGWTAARGTLGAEAATLFAILFLWQIPHFLAIAWIYRDDYARGGFPMLPVVEPRGTRTARDTVISTIALIAASIAPVALGFAGPAYLAGAVALGAAFLVAAIAFAVKRELRSARLLFLSSILYLPALLALLALSAAVVKAA
ncbi:MAG: heme o synthase [bacterium]